MRNIWVSCGFAIKDLFKHTSTYLIIGCWLIITTFIVFGIPTILPSINIALFYSQPTWLTVTYSSVVILTVTLCAVISECIVSKQKMIFLVTKQFSRGQYLCGQFLASLIVVLPCIFLLFGSFLGINTYLVNTQQGHLFQSGVYWYGILITLLIAMFLGLSSVFWHLHIKAGVSTLILVALLAIFILLYPMIWYVDSSDDSIVDPHRLWFTFYGSLTIYLPLTFITYILGITFFLRKRING
jgi:ABC-type transport system involved in multi-copper enzyme maturation permease subunit